MLCPRYEEDWPEKANAPAEISPGQAKKITSIELEQMNLF